MMFFIFLVCQIIDRNFAMKNVVLDIEFFSTNDFLLGRECNLNNLFNLDV